MAHVILFPPQQKPMEFNDAAEVTLNQGTLMFHARKDGKEDNSPVSYVTNIPFLWWE